MAQVLLTHELLATNARLRGELAAAIERSIDLVWFARRGRHVPPQRISGASSDEAVPDERTIRAQARTAIQRGKLPVNTPTRTWGGPGVGANCSVCGVPITTDEMEFEIQFARDGDHPGLDKFHVHIRCFAAWEFERART